MCDRAKLAPHFLAHLARTQNHDWRSADLPSFDVPDADPYQPARWQLNWWSRVWRENSVRAIPVAALESELCDMLIEETTR